MNTCHLLNPLRNIPILAGTEIKYKLPIKLFDQVIGRLWLSSSLGRLKWTVQAEIINNERAAAATQQGAFVSLKKWSSNSREIAK